MMEDAISGFIIYTGMKSGDLDFISKTGCGGPRNKGGACYGRPGLNINTDTLQKQIIDSLSPQKRNVAIQIKRTRVNRVKKQLQTNAKLPGANQNRVRTRATNPITTRNALIAKLNNARRKANAAIKTPTAEPSNPTMNVNNSAKRRNNLNRYINNLNSQFTQVGLPNRLNKTVYMNKLATSNTDTNLNKIKQNALNNVKLLATKGAFKRLMREKYPSITTNNKNMLNSLINGAQNKNKLAKNIGPFINKMQGERQAQRQQGQNRGRNN